jgi:hypothetical protein
MNYKTIENEIDNLLSTGDLNPYEKKLLKAVKTSLTEKNTIIREANEALSLEKEQTRRYREMYLFDLPMQPEDVKITVWGYFLALANLILSGCGLYFLISLFV